jgi:DNA invertase Pin-like site-specific DNA recombinase
LSEVLELGRAGELDILVVRDPYRLSRELAGLLTIEAELQKCGVGIEYLRSTGSTTRVGEALEAVARLNALRIRSRRKNRKRGGTGNA